MPTVLEIYSTWIEPHVRGHPVELVAWGAYVFVVVLVVSVLSLAALATFILVVSLPVSMWHDEEPPLVEADMLDIATELVPPSDRPAAPAEGKPAGAPKRTLKVGGRGNTKVD